MARRLLMLDTRYQTFWSSTTVILFSLVDFVGVVILIVAALHIVKKDQRERKFPGLLKKVIDMILQAAWLTMMWTTLAFIMNERGELEEIDGSENPLNDWSFGQILAFSTWVPVFVEFFYTYLYGIREGLTGNMPSKYKAVPKDDQVRSPERDIEMNIHDESSSEAWRAGTSIPSANTARAGGMNSSTGLATGTERLIAEPTRRVNKTSLKPTRTW
ncbi:hypothetical protein PG989_010943 [Apiospora arundinis]|uniref:Uncharacterized protein n=1 Tax=Apiospora arundinis TaxID=335852 RepID=A0ABR2HQI2_9PEZI